MDIVVTSEVEGRSQMAATVAHKAKHCGGIWQCVLTPNLKKKKGYEKKNCTWYF